MSIFNRFSDESKFLLSQAFEMAKMFNHAYIGSEHVLLALVKYRKRLKISFFDELEIQYNDIFAEIERLAGKGTSPVHINGYTSRTLQAFQKAVELAKDQGKLVDPPDIFLAILEDQDAYCYIALHHLYPEIDEAIQEYKEAYEEVLNNKDLKALEALEGYGVNLTQQAEEGKFDSLTQRPYVIQRMLNVLSRKFKNNPCLIGEPGVGKTAIVESLSTYLLKEHTLYANKIIFQLDIASIVSGTKYRGEFEKRIKAILEAVKDSENIILFFDEIHTLMRAGATEGAIDASNILKTYLQRGNLQLIGATTYDEFRKTLEKDKAFVRRLQTIQVKEPEDDETLMILEGLREEMEAHHKVIIPPESLEIIISLSKRYLPEKFMPDKAVDLLDEACAYLRNHFRDRMELVLDEDSIKDVLSIMTGVPVQNISRQDTVSLQGLGNRIKERIIGQNDAVDVVTRAIKRGRLGLKDPNRPLGSYIFLGSTGVGKTELSKVLAEEVFRKEAFIRLDMSEFMEKQSVSKLIGSPPGYVGYEEGGYLTEQVRRNPYSLILFDEIEKAHLEVYNVLLQILDEGHLMDAKGNRIDFKNTIIIMTSNIGTMELRRKQVGFATQDPQRDYKTMQDVLMGNLKKKFKPEFLNRVDEIVVFNHLTIEDVTDIALIKVEGFLKKVKDLGYQVDIDALSVANLIAQHGFDEEYGARPLNRAVMTYLEDPFADVILSEEIKEEDRIAVQIKDEMTSFEVIKERVHG